MLKKVSMIGGVAAIAVFVVATLMPSAGASDDGTTFIRVNSFTTEETFIDVGPPNESLGDQIVFATNLMRFGKRVGNLGVVCTITSVRTETVQCVGTANFVRWFHGGGQIAVQGLLSGEPTDFTLPITGGSGAFVEADGQVHVHQVNDGLEVLTFELRS